MRHIILGTAGHIDHGKSSLVKALTGVDPDRLKEEKERGITIDIGFADLEYPESGLSIGIVDVPGHEKLIRNMLAGAGGIDLVLLVIAADEGIMPQSHEHLAICNLLKIQSGIVAITKSDLVEKEWLALVMEEIAQFVKGTFLDGAPVIAVSSKTGENLDLLKKEMEKIALGIKTKSPTGLFRLPIDRVFTLKGFGTVITGTALSGRISLEDPIEILPSGLNSRVRGLHSHSRTITSASAGQRVAINLQGVEKEDLTRGDVAVTPSRFSTTRALDAQILLLPDAPALTSKSLVHFYSGTSETIARVIFYEADQLQSGERGLCQLRLKDPVVLMSGDRYIIRRFSPLQTLGGGEVLDPSPRRRRRKDGIADLERLNNGNLETKISCKIEHSGSSGLTRSFIESWIHAGPEAITDAFRSLENTGEIIFAEDVFLHKNSFALLRNRIVQQLAAYHQKNPLKPGMAKEELRTNLRIEQKLFNFILSSLKEISTEKNIVKLSSFRVALSSSEETFKTKILQILEEGGFQPSVKEEILSSLKMDQKQLTDILNMLVKEGIVTRISDSIFLSSRRYDMLLAKLKEHFRTKESISVAEFRDLLNTTRKYALPFLEYLDSHKITIRTGDVRKLLLKG